MLSPLLGTGIKRESTLLTSSLPPSPLDMMLDPSFSLVALGMMAGCPLSFILRFSLLKSFEVFGVSQAVESRAGVGGGGRCEKAEMGEKNAV